MKPYLILYCLITSITFAVAQQAPVAPVRPVVEEYCGEQVTDRYRYMEDMGDPEVQKWFRGQADHARSILGQIPGRDKLEQEILEIANRQMSKVSQVETAGNDRYFYLKTKQGEDIGRLYYRDGYEGEEKLLFDPTAYDSASEKQYALFFHKPSRDGSKIAFSVTADGAEIGMLMVMDVATRTLYPERIDGFWFGELSWLPDNKQFFYLLPQRSNPDTSAQFNKTLLHQVGTESSEDQEILSKTHNPELGIQAIDYPLVYVSSPSPTHLIAELGGVDADRKVFCAPIEQLEQDRVQWTTLADLDDEVGKSVVSVRGDEIFVLTSKNTERFAIVKTSSSNPNLKQSEVVVPEGEEVIKEFVLTPEGLYYSTVANGIEAHLYYLADGAEAPERVTLPTKAGVVDIKSTGRQSSDLWVGLGGWTLPYTRYRYATGTFEEMSLSSKTEYPEFQNLVVEETMIPSHDGTLVPLSVIYQEGTPRDGSAPLMLRGYGAYGTSIEPYFVPDRLFWTVQGGIYAVAHVRGGGELGDAWHQSGKKTTKHNTWKDFIACAEYLIEKKYTSAEKLSINSASAGGILIGRAMTERPDLFAVAIPEVGTTNVLRLEKLGSGPANTKEFGSIQNPEECKALLAMDAYHHVEEKTEYPATLVTAGMNDPRVAAWMPAKFAARLQAATASDKPVLFSVDYQSGHGYANTNTKWASLFADIFSFTLWQTGHPDFQPGETARGER